MGPPRSILFVGDMAPGSTAGHRARALADLGFTVATLDHNPFMDSSVPKLGALIRRFPVWPTTIRFGRAVLEQARRYDAGLIWLDKPILLRPEIVRALRDQGRFTVHYTVDDATGRASEWTFSNILECIPEFDLDLVSRQVSIAEYGALGARDTRYLQLAYDDHLYRPPPAAWGEADKTIDVTFIGSAHDSRPEFLERLWREHGIAVHIFGGRPWRRALSAEASEALLRGGAVYGEGYARAIWSARICLSFITHVNRDDVAHRSFELAACGACVVAERSPEQEAVFEPGREMMFFSSVAECARSIEQLLADPDKRISLGRAAHRRAIRDGYGNQATLREVMEYVASKRPDLGIFPNESRS